MISLPHHPQTTYFFFQALASLVMAAGLTLSLRKELKLSQIFLLLGSIFALTVPGAEAFSRVFAGTSGQSYFGALTGQILGTFFFLSFCKISAARRIKVWRSFCLCAALSYALLRVGCHFRGCCWGGLCTFPWAIMYTHPRVTTPAVFVPLHPAQLYAAFHGICLFAGIWWYTKKYPTRSALGIYMIFFGAGRLVTDAFRADARYYEQTFLNLEPNTALAMIFILVGAAVLARSSRAENRLAPH